MKLSFSFRYPLYYVSLILAVMAMSTVTVFAAEKTDILDSTLDKIARKKSIAGKRKQIPVEPLLQEKAINEFCLQFIQYINDADFKSAYRHLHKYFVAERIADKQITGAIKDAIGKVRKSGACVGTDLLVEKKAGNFAKKIIIVSKYPTWFLKLEFIFYSPASEDNWKLFDLNMNDSLDDLFTASQ